MPAPAPDPPVRAVGVGAPQAAPDPPAAVAPEPCSPAGLPSAPRPGACRAGEQRCHGSEQPPRSGPCSGPATSPSGARIRVATLRARRLQCPPPESDAGRFTVAA